MRVALTISRRGLKQSPARYFTMSYRILPSGNDLQHPEGHKRQGDSLVLFAEHGEERLGIPAVFA